MSEVVAVEQNVSSSEEELIIQRPRKRRGLQVIVKMSYFEAVVLSASSSDDENMLVDRRELGFCGQASRPPLIRNWKCYSGLGAEDGWQNFFHNY